MFHSRFKTKSVRPPACGILINVSVDRSLRNHIITVPPDKICSQTSVITRVYFYAFINRRSISTSCGGRRAGRHRDRIVTNGHGLPRREQSDRYDRSQGYDRTIVR